MKTIPITLLNHYKSGDTNITTCWEAILTDGTEVRSTMHDEDIEVDGEIYYSSSGYSASDIEISSGLSPGNLEVNGLLISPAITSADVEAGRWDNAQIRIFEVNWADPSMGINPLHEGTLGELRAGHTKFIAELQDLFYKYNKTIITLITKECRWRVGDDKCKVNLVPFTVTGSIDSVTANRILNDSSRTEANDWWTKGVMTFTSGLNNGLSMDVKQSWSNGQIDLWLPMPYNIAVNDTYSMTPGCLLRKEEDCRDKYDNVINHGGFADLPGSKIYAVGGNK